MITQLFRRTYLFVVKYDNNPHDKFFLFSFYLQTIVGLACLRDHFPKCSNDMLRTCTADICSYTVSSISSNIYIYILWLILPCKVNMTFRNLEIFRLIALRWMSQDTFDYKSSFVQLMAWCRQITHPYLRQCWPKFMLPHGVSRPQWINQTCSPTCWGSSAPRSRCMIKCQPFRNFWFRYFLHRDMESTHPLSRYNNIT